MSSHPFLLVDCTLQNSSCQVKLFMQAGHAQRGLSLKAKLKQIAAHHA